MNVRMLSPCGSPPCSADRSEDICYFSGPELETVELVDDRRIFMPDC